MNVKIIVVMYFVAFSFFSESKSQNISMNFPKFAGKNYDFIIFQGSASETIYKGVIPNDGKFILTIPKKNKPYIGMSRWLITGTEEGGGLDMYIPGHDFSVSCSESIPTDKNIIYVNNYDISKLNKLNKQQEGILSRYHAMLLAMRSYETSSPNYSFFQSELKRQKNDFISFQRKLRSHTDYISRLFVIINITRGIAEVLDDLPSGEYKRAKDISQYILQDLDWDTLYTSGHWASIIEAWVNIHKNVLKDPKLFTADFNIISSKIPKDLYKDFYNKTSDYIKQNAKEN